MTITFITGANRGIGRETARLLVNQGHLVLLGARDERAGRAAADAVGARFVQIDVADDDSVAAAAADVESNEGLIDVLINNAGITEPSVDPTALSGADVLTVLDVNLVGSVRTVTAFLPLLQRSADPVIINVSSGMGSLEITHDPSRIESTAVIPVYAASKAALTMITTQYAKALPGVRVNAVDPGHTATNLTRHTGPQSVTEGSEPIVKLATEGPGHGSGRFVERHRETTW